LLKRIDAAYRSYVQEKSKRRSKGQDREVTNEVDTGDGRGVASMMRGLGTKKSRG